MRVKKGNTRTQTIKIIGCGGIGSWLVDPLVQFLNHSLYEVINVHLIDGDDYEERNRERQQFDHKGNKASITAMRLRERFPGRIIFHDHPSYVTRNNIVKLIQEGDTVFLCVDNHKTRKLVSDRMEELDDALLISGGNAYTDGNVYIHIRKSGEDVTLPIANRYHPELVKPTDKNPVDKPVSGCQALVIEPQLLFTNFNVAAKMLAAYYGLLQKGEKLGYNEVNFDILSNQARAQLRKA